MAPDRLDPAARARACPGPRPAGVSGPALKGRVYTWDTHLYAQVPAMDALSLCVSRACVCACWHVGEL